MKEITEIKKIGKGLRYSLYLDGEFFGVYEAEILARHCLKTGEKFDDEFFDKLRLENGDYACFNRGLTLLEKGMKSEKMLRDYLRGKDYPKESIDKATDKLKEYGYIDDESFCESYISSYRTKSKKRLKYDLLYKGIKEEIVEEKLAEVYSDEDEQENLFMQAERYMRAKEFDLKTKQKFYNHFASKGFGSGMILSTWEKIKNDRT